LQSYYISKQNFFKKTPFKGVLFSLLEIIIVLTILGLVMALVLPNFGSLPESLKRKKLLQTINTAFQNAAIRAQAFGATVHLKADPENNTLTISTASASSVKGKGGVDKFAVSAISGADVYELPNWLKWLNEDEEETRKVIKYTFYANGEASGPEMLFKTGDFSYSVNVDNLSGKALIKELTEE